MRSGGKDVRHIVTWALSAALLLLLVAACAGPKPNLDAPTETEVTRNLRTAFDYLYDNYYDEGIRLENVVIPGLENLRSLAPGLQVVDAPIPLYRYRTEVLLNGAVVHTFHKPAWYAGDGWAAVVRETIKALRTASPKFAAATWIETTDLVLAGAAAALDDESIYVSRQELKALGLITDNEDEDGDGQAKEAETEEPRAAAGIRLHEVDGTTRIAQVRRNSAAAQAGLRVGDIVESVNGQSSETFSQLQLAMQFVGPPDSEVTLLTRPAGSAQTREIKLQRETVSFSAPVAVWRDRILYLQLTSIWGDTIDAVEQLLRGEHAKGEDAVDGIVLDLRGTYSGNAFAAARFLDIFIEPGQTYFRSKGRSIYDNHRFRSRETPVDTSIPLVVLVNGETAGAAEVMAAAVQELGRGVVLGSNTQGQGRLQQGVFLYNGGILAFTGTLLFAPAGYALDERGILPMICTEALGSGAQALAGLRSGRGHLDRASRNADTDSANDVTIEAQREKCVPRMSQDDSDLDLAEAILGNPALYASILEADRP